MPGKLSFVENIIKFRDPDNQDIASITSSGNSIASGVLEIHASQLNIPGNTTIHETFQIINSSSTDIFTDGTASMVSGDLYATEISAVTGVVTTLTGTTASITNVTSTTGVITNLTGETATITNVSATTGEVTTLTSTTGVITNLTGETATITNVSATTGEVTTLTSTTGVITNLTGETATITNISATTGEVTTLTSTTGVITNLTGETATITNVSATTGEVTTLTSTTGVITNLTGETATITNVSATTGEVTTLTSTTGVITTLTGTNATITNIDCDNISSGEYKTKSDRRLKKNILNISNPLGKINSVNGVAYTWKHNNENTYGVIAQEIREILPYAVKDTGTHLVVNYNCIIGLLIESVKELNIKCNNLKNEINELKK